MKRFVQIEFWYYMDAKPFVDTRVFNGEDETEILSNAHEFVELMKSTWSSGTTKLLGILNKEDAKKFIDKQIAKEKSNWKDDSLGFIVKISKTYEECYG